MTAMSTQGSSAMNTYFPNDVDMNPIKALPSSSTDSSPAPSTISPVKNKRGRPFKKSTSADSAQSSAANLEETKQILKSKVSIRGRKKGKGSRGDTSDFISCTRIVKKMLMEAECENDSDSQTTDPALDTSQMTSDESLLAVEEVKQRQDMSKQKEKKKGVGEESEEEDEVRFFTTPKKRKPGRPPKKATQQNKDDWESETPAKRKRLDCDITSLGEGEEGDEMGYEAITTPKKRKPGRPPKKMTQQNKDDREVKTPKKRKILDCDIPRLPGTKLKICSHCGTVADKVKAKKCFNCKKFFFSHWAQRCKIPPCPSCHFSRKSRRYERIPSNCEKCGFKLPLDLLEESSGTHMSTEDGDGMESLESGSTSVRYTPDPFELDPFEAKSITTEYSEGKQTGYLETEEDKEEMSDEQKHARGTGNMKSEEESVEQAEKSARDMSGTCHVGTGNTPPKNTNQEGATVVMATTRSGRAYKHDTTPERTYGGLAMGSLATETPCFSGGVVESVRPSVPQPPFCNANVRDSGGLPHQVSLPQQDTCSTPALGMPSPPREASPPSTREENEGRLRLYTDDSLSVSLGFPIIQNVMSLKEPVGVEDIDHIAECQEATPLAEPECHSEQCVLSQTAGGGDNPAHQLTVTGRTHPSSPAHVPSQKDAALLERESAQHGTPSLKDATLLEWGTTQYATSSPLHTALDETHPSSTIQERGNAPCNPLHALEREVEQAEQSSAAGMLGNTDTQITLCVKQPDLNAVTTTEFSPVPVGTDLSEEQGHKDTYQAKVGSRVDSSTDVRAMMMSDVGTDEADDLYHGEPAIPQHSPNNTEERDPAPEGDLTMYTQPVPYLTTVTVDQSTVQTDSGAETTEEEENVEGKKSVIRNIYQSLPFLRSVLSGIRAPASHQDDSVRAKSVPAIPSMSYKHVATSIATTSGTQSLPVLYTSNLGLEDANKSRATPAVMVTSSGESNLLTAPVATATAGSDQVPTEVSFTAETTPVNLSSVSVPTSMDSLPAGSDTHDKDVDMVVIESGTPAATMNTPQSRAKVAKKPNQSAVHKPSKGKEVAGKDGKSTAPKKKKQPKSQEAKEVMSKDKPTKPKKPRAKKSKALTTSSLPEQTSAALSMLATSIAQELQRKPSIPSPFVPGQHSKHSFSQYFYSEENKLIGTPFTPPTNMAGSSGASSGENTVEMSSEGSASVGGKESKRVFSKQKEKDSQEPPVKKKKLAHIAPNNPLTSTTNSGSALGPLTLKGASSLAPLTPALIPQLCQLAATLKMSSSNLLTALQSVLPGQKSGIAGGSIGGTSTTTSSLSASNPVSLPPSLFPPLTMSFQSLAAALSNMPIATTPIRLSGTQVTARPLLPSTVSSSLQTTSTASATPLSMTLPSSIPAIFPSLGVPNTASGDQLSMLKGVFSSEASVGTQTVVKLDTLKPLIPAPSSLSPQLLSLPNPPQLTSSHLPLPPPTLVPKDLNPMFQSVLSHLPSAPPPLTSHPTLHAPSKMPELKMCAPSAVPFPVIKSNSSASSVSYMTLPMTSGSSFTSLPILPISLSPLLPPPPHLLTQSHPSSKLHVASSRLYVDSGNESTSVVASSQLHQPNPIIPSLLKSGNTVVLPKPELGSVLSSVLPASHASHPASQQKVIYTQSITSPKVCPVPQPTTSTVSGTSVDSNLQVP